MADLIDFSNIGKGLDTQMGNAALQGQRIGVNAATLPGSIAATNAGNAASVSNSGLQVNNNQRQQDFQMQSAALASNPNASPQDYQALANQYPEFGSQVGQNLQQTQNNYANIRKQMTASGVATVAAIKARLDANDVPGALATLEAQAVRQENSNDQAGAAATRAYENLIKTNPDQGKQIASGLLNVTGANDASDVYSNQSNQARAIVAQSTVPAAIGQAQAQASQAGTAAQFAPVQAQANVQSTQAATAQTVSTTGLNNRDLAGASPSVIAASNPVYQQSQLDGQQSQQLSEIGSQFAKAEDGTSGVLGATWDNAARKWTGDLSQFQNLKTQAQSLVTQAEVGSMVAGNFTDASTARAAQAVPQLTDGPKAWANYTQERSKFLAAKAAWGQARGDWMRNNNASLGEAYRDFTINLPNGTAKLVKSGDSFTKFSKQAAPSYYSTTSAPSFDPTK